MDANSHKVKTAIACYWRYARGCPIVAFEAPQWIDYRAGDGLADVLVVTSDNFLIEVEVKVSMADLKRDKKKYKHQMSEMERSQKPTHYFYFAVPRELANEAVAICDQLYPYAGVMGVESNSSYGSIEMYRIPRMLSKQKLTLLQLAQIVNKQSGTLCALAIKVVELSNELELSRKRNQEPRGD